MLLRIDYLKVALLIILSLTATSASAPDLKVVYICSPVPENTLNRLIAAVVQVESRGDTLAYNPQEEAVGAFQIRPVRLLDYYQRTGISYKIEQCYNYEISKEIFLYYATQAGYPDDEMIARNWNGSGKATLVYWEKVTANL
jgi:hypothetical protein